MPHIDAEKLKPLLGQALTYRGIPCHVIEILAEEPALVLHDDSHRKVLEANQYGDAGDWLPQIFTVTVLNVRRDDLNPELPELAKFNLLC